MNTDGITLEIHSGLVKQSEGFHILIILFCSHGKADIDEGRVAGVSHGLCQRLCTMARFSGTADGPAVHLEGTGTVERTVKVDSPLLQRHGQRQDLISRTRLIGIIDRFVTPLQKLILSQQFVIGLVGRLRKRLLLFLF